MSNLKRYLALAIFAVYMIAATGFVLSISCCAAAASDSMTSMECCSVPSEQYPQKDKNNFASCCIQFAVIAKVIQHQFWESANIGTSTSFFQLAALPVARDTNLYASAVLQEAHPVTNAPPDAGQRIALHKLHHRFTYYD